jgi:hypothetical protein
VNENQASQMKWNRQDKRDCFGFKSKLESKSEEQRPEEVRITFHPLADVPDQTISIHQVLCITERDEGVINQELFQMEGVHHGSDDRQRQEHPVVAVKKFDAGFQLFTLTSGKWDSQQMKQQI